MSELDYIGADELVFNNDIEGGIHSGGFSVNSIMMKAGMSPIMTMNINSQTGGTNQVSDLFNDLVVPNWALSYNNRMVGGKYVERNQDDSDGEDDVVEDDLHDKLLELVKEHKNSNNNNNNNKSNKKITRRPNKILIKKRNTRKRK